MEQFNKIEKKHKKAVLFMVTGGLEYLVERAGGDCNGFSMRNSYGDCLLIIRAEFEGKAMVAFVGSATGAGALSRAHHELRNGGLKWRKDKFKE